MKTKHTAYLILLLTTVSLGLRAQDFSRTRLSKMLFYNYNADKPKPDMQYEFFYDASGNLNKINYSQDGKLFEVTDNFKYNPAGKLLSYDSKGIKGTSARHHSIEYDASGRRVTKTETVLQDGKLVKGDVTHYSYSGDVLTRIREHAVFSGNTFDTVVYKIGSDGFVITPGMNTAHPNPMLLTGNGEVDLSDNNEWPVAEYFTETPVLVQPTFGTTTTQYQYDKNGLLTRSRWKYVTEKEHVVQSTGKLVYLYTQLKTVRP